MMRPPLGCVSLSDSSTLSLSDSSVKQLRAVSDRTKLIRGGVEGGQQSQRLFAHRGFNRKWLVQLRFPQRSVDFSGGLRDSAAAARAAQRCAIRLIDNLAAAAGVGAIANTERASGLAIPQREPAGEDSQEDRLKLMQQRPQLMMCCGAAPDRVLMSSGQPASADSKDGGEVTKTVTFSNGQTVPFTVVGTDPTGDLAIVRAQGVSGLTPITIGSSKDVKVGQEVVAIGSPLGLQGTVTTGIVSALDRPVAAGDGPDGNVTALDAIQTDAAINPGNSGGALVNMNGELSLDAVD